MAAILQGVKNMFAQEKVKGMNLGNAYAALNESDKIVKEKARICGLLQQKIQEKKRLDFAEARYALQHCGKTQNNLRSVALLPTPGSTSPESQYLQRILNTPIDSTKYPKNKGPGNPAIPLRGGKRKTRKQKRRHTKKRKHTRRY